MPPRNYDRNSLKVVEPDVKELSIENKGELADLPPNCTHHNNLNRKSSSLSNTSESPLITNSLKRTPKRPVINDKRSSYTAKLRNIKIHFP